jgi:hypothetical protein
MKKSDLAKIEKLRESVVKAFNEEDYEKTLKRVIKLADTIYATDTDETVWYLGEFDYGLDGILFGTYCYASDYHGGQNSLEYAALSAVGTVFPPGMTSGVEEGSSAEMWYEGLAEMK